ncbi:glycine--tRNA ligase subunit beta [Magnetospira sp. QH-2]|uniref:glycine--tRNA ligase subunit beta n=1 Tax=Magnetospira sp. (strain QH-2) TaxID=1288970 RepID=UPI0003E81A67|nr:glycine--tRNA ligase subunit beta [Magnetospira sp. QH-2]CCQ73643.1 Glycine tRNA synthetase, beta subunit [Magnetospira sp. QH-2]
MADLLLELFSEEIPARMQAKAVADLSRLVMDGLKKSGLDSDKTQTYVTPRRLVLAVEGLPAQAPDITGERKGPKIDAPEQAIAGFKRSIPDGAKIEERETKKGTLYFATWEEKGRATAEILAEVLPEALNALPWPKSMRWGSNARKWVRPLHSIIALFEGVVVPFSFGPVNSGNTTRGHRFMAPEEITVSGIADYVKQMRGAKVMLDREERKALILEEALRLSDEESLVLKRDQGLLEEVAGLVEWPVLYMGQIDKAFMEVPKEVLITSMRAHQKYFSCLTLDGLLAPRFIVAANRETPDHGKQIIAGNERVLRARLSDARFFWDQDHKSTLEDRIPALDDMVFHAKLGTVKDKSERIAEIATALCKYVPGADPDKAHRAGRLCKADLVSEMVYEFPEVQGIMGRYLARDEGEDMAVAEAIAEHYAPQGPGDDCPSAPESVAVSLADKIDTLVGFWAIGETPTGSKDPFALRRAALGVIRLIVENKLRVPLYGAFNVAGGWLTHQGAVAEARNLPELLDFFADRLKVHLKEQGVRHDLISAVFALGNEDDLVRLLARVEALGQFLDSDDGANLLVAYRRATNIVRIEEKKDGLTYGDPVDPAVLVQDEEKALVATLEEVEPMVAQALIDENFEAAMTNLAQLRGPVDAFFDQVTVNSDDPAQRVNRLRLLARIGHVMGGVADFSNVEG